MDVCTVRIENIELWLTSNNILDDMYIKYRWPISHTMLVIVIWHFGFPFYSYEIIYVGTILIAIPSSQYTKLTVDTDICFVFVKDQQTFLETKKKANDIKCILNTINLS